MSVETWKAAHYPRPASGIRRLGEALAHTLQKWCGLRHGVLLEHGLRKVTYYLEEISLVNLGVRFFIGEDTCALCILYREQDCVGCPLSRIERGDERIHCYTHEPLRRRSRSA
jgi:hypothetical protein